jgi:septum formation protein
MSRPLILASKSPRRSQLLQEAGFDFTVQTFDVDESFPEDMPVDDVAPMLAQKKAHAAKHLITGQEIIISADSVVILEGVIYNKPADYAEAFKMISLLSGKTHRVITGVCLLCKEKEVVFSSVSKVTFAKLSAKEIAYYIQKCQPFDKAGAYGVQDWIGLCKVKKIQGTYANVMGLPVDLVYKELRKLMKFGL